MATWIRAALIAVVGIVLPQLSQAQGVADEMNSLHSVLEQLYDEMMPLCSKLIGVGQGIAGFAATWYIASRVWRHIANAEPIDFYPLFRPFVLGFAVLIFPSVLAMINGIMKPTVTATGQMVKDSDKAITLLLKQKKKQSRKLLHGKCMLVNPAVAIETNGISTPILMILQVVMKEYLKVLATI